MAILTKRSEKAVALNLLGRKVLIFDETGKREETWKDSEGNLVRHVEYPSQHHDKAIVLIPTSRYGDQRRVCSLYRTTSNRDIDKYKGQEDTFYLLTHGACLHSDDHYGDYIVFAREAQAPVIETGDRVCILVVDHEKKTAVVHTVIADTVNGRYSPACHFLDEPEEDVLPKIRKILKG